MKKLNRKFRNSLVEKNENFLQAKEDVWAGGANLEQEIDYSKVFTGESNVEGTEFFDVILNKVMRKIEEKSLKNKKRLKEEFGNTLPAGRDLGYGEGEGKSAKMHLDKIARYAQSLHDKLLDEDDLPEWVQSKIAVSDHNMSAIYHYLDHKIKTLK
jgi:hypothetical protein